MCKFEAKLGQTFIRYNLQNLRNNEDWCGFGYLESIKLCTIKYNVQSFEHFEYCGNL